MEAINSFPLEAIHPQKQGMALDDFFVDFQVRAKFHTDTHSFHAVLDLAVEAKMANKILSLSKPLEVSATWIPKIEGSGQQLSHTGNQGRIPGVPGIHRLNSAPSSILPDHLEDGLHRRRHYCRW